jgi:hypothetical protein
MKIQKATASYEAWLGKQLTILPADLEHKHQAMASDPFPFLRATFYRWMQLWEDVCEECNNAPRVLAVGDLHVENFGTWRDVEGRLTWGINDFDEVAELPYTVDLVRLATSAHMAIKEAKLQIATRDACSAILQGYVKGLESGGRAFVLAEEHHWLRMMMTGVLRDPVAFWTKIDGLQTLRAKVPKDARRAMEKMLPKDGLKYRIAHRVAGLGSLGRERYVAIAEYCGGKVVREGKALAPSACAWANPSGVSNKIRYQEILDTSVRSIDPFVRLKGGWIVRRLAPDCSRVELSSMPKERDENRLLQSMGFETANVHLGTPKAARAILADLKKRPEHWLHVASESMVHAVVAEWKEWRESMAPAPADKKKAKPGAGKKKAKTKKKAKKKKK